MVMEKNIYVICSILFKVLDHCESQKVELGGPMTAVRGEFVWLNCTSDVAPLRQTAEFLVDGVTIDSLRLHGKSCFTTHKICSDQSCFCSIDGKTYATRIDTQLKRRKFEVACIMKFMSNIPFFKQSNWTIEVLDPPVPKIYVESPVECNSSSTVSLVCHFTGGQLGTYGFDSWYHFYKGTHIRHLNSSINKHMSILHIQQCSYEDSGEYMCSAWNEMKGKKYYSNRTVLLSVYGSPVIIETDSYMIGASGQRLCVIYYSATVPIGPHWLENRQNKVQNSTTFHMQTSRRNASLIIYNNTFIEEVYCSNLSILDVSYGAYTVVLENGFGTTKFDFMLKSGLHSFSLRTILWALTAIAVFIVTVGMMGVFMKRKSMHVSVNTEFHRSIERRAIYYAAPADENNIHIYNTPDVDVRNDGDSSGHYTDIGGPYEELDMDKREHNQYEAPHNYIELLV